ncbi:flagellar export chaperone FliS [Legionella lytica]|jgi:flagellar protein FliS|uniref:Flagellar secretion chaperone FliS n=1 Tax=Legionella lytica TaxID=96232 RepID=A0ABY4Y594_9GAMM|nr:flagellar export chaperone FliS [Legionella lytica]USQ12518.1 flagellar export chaperone FliS [Legionella lytica]
MKNPYNKAAEQYKSIELKTRVAAADPHELINLLLQGARNHIAAAQGSIERKQIREKGEHISKALGIVAGLKTCLNQEEGGEIAANLLQIYEHIEILLLKANLHNDKDLLAKSTELLREIHEAWKEISPKSSETTN